MRKSFLSIKRLLKTIVIFILPTIMEMLNILLDSGFSIHQTIEIVNGDNSNEHLEFVDNFNNRIDKGWVSEIQPINIKFSNTEDPENSNIELESLGGHFYTIYTESNDLSPLEMVEHKDNFKLV
jgi:hypothetical protein